LFSLESFLGKHWECSAADSDCPSLVHHDVASGYDDKVSAFAAGNVEDTEAAVEIVTSEVELAVVSGEEQGCESEIVQLASEADIEEESVA
jgi:hypothetical protein